MVRHKFFKQNSNLEGPTLEQNTAIESILGDFAKEELLPDSFIELARQWYWPLSRELISSIKTGSIRVLGVSGSQGSGKSTLASLLCRIFKDHDGLRVVELSLDDFYLPLADRQSLAEDIHPLFQTRGVPGTHDVQLATDVINSLLTPQQVRIPRFDKACDDRKAFKEWDVVDGPADLVILEGWCLSIPPISTSALETPQNLLETEQDAEGVWRRYLNQSLGQHYPSLFNLIDYLIYLKAPNFDAVRRWRGNQEKKLADKVSTTLNAVPASANKVMDQNKLDFFMQHYERLTMHGFECLPTIANVTYSLSDEQQIIQRSNKQQ